jgi:hypothetical protein
VTTIPCGGLENKPKNDSSIIVFGGYIRELLIALVHRRSTLAQRI